MRFAFTALMAIVLALLCGCSTLPAHVKEPPRDAQGNIAEVTGSNGPVPVAMNITALDTQLKSFSITWDNAETELRYELDGADSLEFASLVWSAYKMATGRLHDAKWGAAAAGGVGLFENKYQIQVQAGNYRNATTAMRCLYKNVHSLPSDFWTGVFKSNGELAFSKADLTKAISDSGDDSADPISGYGTLKDLWSTINSAIVEIDTRLRDQQRDLRIGTPSSQELTQAFGGGASAQAGADRAAPIIADAANSVQLPVAAQTIADAIVLPKKLEACVAAMGK